MKRLIRVPPPPSSPPARVARELGDSCRRHLRVSIGRLKRDFQSGPRLRLLLSLSRLIRHAPPELRRFRLQRPFASGTSIHVQHLSLNSLLDSLLFLYLFIVFIGTCRTRLQRVKINSRADVPTSRAPYFPHTS